MGARRVDTWVAIVGALVSAIIGAGLLQGVTSWVKARAKKLSDEGDALKVKAGADAKARDAEVTAKVKLLEAEAEETRVDAMKDKALLERVEQLSKEVQDCKAAHEACEAAARRRDSQISELTSKVEVLYAKAGLTPPNVLKVTP
jgi:hypothetical protein